MQARSAGLISVALLAVAASVLTQTAFAQGWSHALPRAHQMTGSARHAA